MESKHVGHGKDWRLSMFQHLAIKVFFHSSKFGVISLVSLSVGDNWSLSLCNILFSVFPKLWVSSSIDFSLAFSVLILKCPKMIQFCWCLIINDYSTIVITLVLIHSNSSYLEGRPFCNRTSLLAPPYLMISTEMFLTLYFCFWCFLCQGSSYCLVCISSIWFRVLHTSSQKSPGPNSQPKLHVHRSLLWSKCISSSGFGHKMPPGYSW